MERNLVSASAHICSLDIQIRKQPKSRLCLLCVAAFFNGIIYFINLSFPCTVLNQPNSQKDYNKYANIGKTVDAAVRQMEAIKFLKKKNRFSSLPDKLLEIASLRLDNPEMSFTELAQLSGIARSTVKNRLNKIVEYAEELKEKNNA